jgi:hypothetical protein
MPRVLLSRVKSTHTRLRTDTVLGWTNALPAVGEPFVMSADPLDPAASMRLVTTTPVVALGAGGEFSTENSTYRLELVPV